MSYERPGAATYHFASRPTMHGTLTVENDRVGRAVKQQAFDPNSARNADRALIAIGEKFVIRGLGLYRASTGSGKQLAPLAGSAVGDPVYINENTGVVAKAPGTGLVPLARVSATPTSARPTPAGEIEIDLNERGSIPTA